MDAASASQDGQPTLILAPFRSHIEIKLYPGSRTLRADCGHWAWLSPQGEAYVGTCRTICVDCLEIDDVAKKEMTAVEGWTDDIRQNHGEDGLAAVRAAMRLLGIAEGEGEGS